MCCWFTYRTFSSVAAVETFFMYRYQFNLEIIFIGDKNWAWLLLLHFSQCLGTCYDNPFSVLLVWLLVLLMFLSWRFLTSHPLPTFLSSPATSCLALLLLLTAVVMMQGLNTRILELHYQLEAAQWKIKHGLSFICLFVLSRFVSDNVQIKIVSQSVTDLLRMWIVGLNIGSN